MASESIDDVAAEPAVLLEKRGPVAWVTLNRPQAVNAINNAIRSALPQAIHDADQDTAIRVIVVQGAGERGFCAGADIKEFSAATPPILRRQQLAHDAWVSAFDRARKPIIASIHGFCLGGGLEIAVACDIRIASEDALLGFPEVGLGLITGAGGSQKLARIVGQGRALDMMLTTERMPAAEAHRVGLVTRLVKPEARLEQTVALAEKMARLPPLAMAFAKEVVKKGLDTDLETACRLEVDLFSLLLTTNDRLEAAAAFKEKRPPQFTGT